MKLITKTCSDGVISARFVNGGTHEISGYRICFSLLSKCSVVSGCKIMLQFGGYVEMAPDNQEILKIGSSLCGHILIIDALKLTFRKVKLNKRSNCYCYEK